MRILTDFKKFLSDRDNKERMFELFKQVWIEDVAKLVNRVVHFARGSTCMRITRTGSVNVEDLVKDHEEADIKLYLLKSADKSNDDQNTFCEVRSSSGNIDIIPIILFWGFELERTSTFISITDGIGKHRKILGLLTWCDLTYQQKKALISAHAFTGNDNVASLLCK